MPPLAPVFSLCASAGEAHDPFTTPAQIYSLLFQTLTTNAVADEPPAHATTLSVRFWEHPVHPQRYTVWDRRNPSTPWLFVIS